MEFKIAIFAPVLWALAVVGLIFIIKLSPKFIYAVKQRYATFTAIDATFDEVLPSTLPHRPPHTAYQRPTIGQHVDTHI